MRSHDSLAKLVLAFLEEHIGEIFSTAKIAKEIQWGNVASVGATLSSLYIEGKIRRIKKGSYSYYNNNALSLKESICRRRVADSSHQRVINFMNSDPTRVFSLREISEGSRVLYGTTSMALTHLVGYNLVERVGKGMYKLIKFDYQKESIPQQILGLLAQNPKKSFRLHEIVEALKEKHNSVKSAVMDLAQAGKIIRVDRGSYSSIEYDTTDPIVKINSGSKPDTCNNKVISSVVAHTFTVVLPNSSRVPENVRRILDEIKDIVEDEGGDVKVGKVFTPNSDEVTIKTSVRWERSRNES